MQEEVDRLVLGDALLGAEAQRIDPEEGIIVAGSDMGLKLHMTRGDHGFARSKRARRSSRRLSLTVLVMAIVKPTSQRRKCKFPAG